MFLSTLYPTEIDQTAKICQNFNCSRASPLLRPIPVLIRPRTHQIDLDQSRQIKPYFTAVRYTQFCKELRKVRAWLRMDGAKHVDGMNSARSVWNSDCSADFIAGVKFEDLRGRCSSHKALLKYLCPHPEQRSQLERTSVKQRSVQILCNCIKINSEVTAVSALGTFRCC